MSENNNECNKSDCEQTPGTFSWREMVTQDVEGSKKFYTDLLGWTVDTMDMGGGNSYNMFMQGDHPVAGMMKSPKEDVPSMWISYITVADLEATVEKAQALGAHLCMPITEIPGKGRFAGVADPQGAAIAFWQFN